MPKPLQVLPAAIAEAAAAYDWYLARSPAAAERFQAEFDRAVEAVAETPTAWPRHLYGTRRYVFDRFPYQLVYRDERDRILVIAAPHFKQRPGYWKGR